jgi:hypothetical protein
MLEREILEYLKTETVRHGGECRRLGWTMRRGAPDLLVLRPDRDPLFVETKAPKKKPEPHQLREHERMRALGCKVLVIDSLEAVDELFW